MKGLNKYINLNVTFYIHVIHVCMRVAVATAVNSRFLAHKTTSYTIATAKQDLMER